MQGTLHWIAFDLPAIRMVVQSRIVAEGGCTGQLDQQSMLGEVHGRIANANASLGRVTVAGYRIDMMRRCNGRHGHFVARERSRFVGANNRNRSQCLDRGQTAHDGVASRHRLNTDRQRDRQDSRKSLGYRGHRQGDHSHEKFGERQMADEIAIDKQDGCEDQDQDRQPAGKPVHLPS